MSEQKEEMETPPSLNYELYLAICDLEGLKHALSTECGPIDIDAMCGLCRVVERLIDHLRDIDDRVKDFELVPVVATG